MCGSYANYLPSNKNNLAFFLIYLHKIRFSSWETIISGVPQGSDFRPLLFVIYIHDLPCGIYHTLKPVIYVVDTSLLNTAKSTKELQIKAKVTLVYKSKWFLVNGLILNIHKRNIVSQSKHYLDETFLINYQNNSIK